MLPMLVLIYCLVISIVKAGTTRVECLDYDATVDALMALPPAPAPLLV